MPLCSGAHLSPSRIWPIARCWLFGGQIGDLGGRNKASFSAGSDGKRGCCKNKHN